MLFLFVLLGGQGVEQGLAGGFVRLSRAVSYPAPVHWFFSFIGGIIPSVATVRASFNVPEIRMRKLSGHSPRPLGLS
ncbi:MAG TPA: hypothetical protein DEH78_10050 [Solibacterales bacterium]|nr:hypothetical protein [Bryobacterales bacterium]